LLLQALKKAFALIISDQIGEEAITPFSKIPLALLDIACELRKSHTIPFGHFYLPFFSACSRAHVFQ
jgi:hypothetical protein